MRVLILATTFPRPANRLIGPWALEQAQLLRRAGCAVRVVSPHPWFPPGAGVLRKARQWVDCPPEADFDGLRVVYPRVPYYAGTRLGAWADRKPIPAMRWVWRSLRGRLLRLVDAFKPDVVWAHHSAISGLLARELYDARRLPYVTVDHDNGDVRSFLIPGPRQATARRVFDTAAAAIGISNDMSDALRAAAPGLAVVTLHHGFDIDGAGPKGHGVAKIAAIADVDHVADAAGVDRAGDAGGVERVGGVEVVADAGGVDRAGGVADLEGVGDAGGVTRAGGVAGVADVKRPAGVGDVEGVEGTAGVETSVAGRGVEDAGSSGASDAPADGDVVIFSLGTFYDRKNMPTLARAFIQIAPQFSGARLHIGGDGAERPMVQKLVDDAGLGDRVRLLGPLAHPAAMAAMRRADVFALVGYDEPYGVVYVEAAAAGLPLVLGRDCGFADVVTDGREALLVDPRDAASVAGALARLLADGPRRRAMGRAARQLYEQRLTGRVWARRMIEVFDAAIAKRPAGEALAGSSASPSAAGAPSEGSTEVSAEVLAGNSAGRPTHQAGDGPVGSAGEKSTADTRSHARALEEESK